ncbi:MAG: (deoxy)nucleoside triphosphate pyrophosphohydrolase [Candidatus Cryptobacteroides sp.]|jgi:8-oxo-dGTP diphosphatase|nr:(deoxy)nucleoside triphosphate pyrophosphohydrolase [Rikenellaceae bacterium]
MKSIEVAAAIIVKDGKILATQRGYGKWKGWWEFPGGKIEAGEKAQEALRREIQEELEIEIAIDKFIQTVEYDYPDFHLTMHCFLCHVVSGQLELLEHADAVWLDASGLDNVKWLPADLEVLPKIKQELSL